MLPDQNVFEMRGEYLGRRTASGSSDSVAGFFAHGRIGESAAATDHDVLKLSVGASPVQCRNAQPQNWRGLVKKEQRLVAQNPVKKGFVFWGRLLIFGRWRDHFSRSIKNVTHSHTCSRNSIHDSG
jgi:hypothetical protein